MTDFGQFIIQFSKNPNYLRLIVIHFCNSKVSYKAGVRSLAHRSLAHSATKQVKKFIDIVKMIGEVLPKEEEASLIAAAERLQKTIK